MINCCIICGTFLFCVVYVMYVIKHISMIYKHTKTEAIEIFDYFAKKAYDSIYESDLVTHIVNGVSLNNDERETYERNFIKKCFLFMGKKNLNILINFYGDKETLIVNLLSYLRENINKDGLTKIVQQQINEQQEKQV